jgi:hypothetical protein
MNKSIRVVPAILTADPKALEAMLRQAGTFTDYVQIDIMDAAQRYLSRSASLPNRFRHCREYRLKRLWSSATENQLEKSGKSRRQKAIFHFEATKQVPCNIETVENWV